MNNDQFIPFDEDTFQWDDDFDNFYTTIDGEMYFWEDDDGLADFIDQLMKDHWKIQFQSKNQF